MSPTVRDLLERYEEHKEDTDPTTAMQRACDDLLEEMDGETPDHYPADNERSGGGA